jgi:hypothetical protein
VEEVTDCQYLANVKRHIQRQGTVLWIAKACIKGYYTEQESYVNNNKNQRKKDIVILDPSYKHKF